VETHIISYAGTKHICICLTKAEMKSISFLSQPQSTLSFIRSAV